MLQVLTATGGPCEELGDPKAAASLMAGPHIRYYSAGVLIIEYPDVFITEHLEYHRMLFGITIWNVYLEFDILNVLV
jgi:hypothetical protein